MQANPLQSLDQWDEFVTSRYKPERKQESSASTTTMPRRL